MALAAYRHVLRAMRIAFKDDDRVLSAARQQVRASFAQSADLPPSGSEATAHIQHAEEVAQILRHNIVQGWREQRSAGDQRVGQANSSEENWRLRIHKDTERGDNDDLRTAAKQDGQWVVTGQCGR